MKSYNMKLLFKSLIATTMLSLIMASVATANPDNPPYDKKYSCMHNSEHGPQHPSKMGPPHYLPFLHSINLTEAQKDKIFALEYAEMPKMRAQMKARYQLEKELMQLSDNYSESKANAIAEQLATLERDSVLAKVHHHQEVLNLLTPEQRKQAAEQKANFEKHHEKSNI